MVETVDEADVFGVDLPMTDERRIAGRYPLLGDVADMVEGAPVDGGDGCLRVGLIEESRGHPCVDAGIRVAPGAPLYMRRFTARARRPTHVDVPWSAADAVAAVTDPSTGSTGLNGLIAMSFSLVGAMGVMAGGTDVAHASIDEDLDSGVKRMTLDVMPPGGWRKVRATIRLFADDGCHGHARRIACTVGVAGSRVHQDVAFGPGREGARSGIADLLRSVCEVSDEWVRGARERGMDPVAR